jgi:hypothetical protein
MGSRVRHLARLLSLGLFVFFVRSSSSWAQPNLLGVPSDAIAPAHEPEIPGGAGFFRVDVYSGHAPPDGTYLEDFASANQNGRIVPILVPDPLDRAALGHRAPLVLVHGIMLKDARDHSAINPEKAAIWDNFRRNMPASLRRFYKVYLYVYQTIRGPEPPGKVLAEKIRATLATDGSPDRGVAILSHSMGGLTMRHAMRESHLGDQVVFAGSIASPHHGSIVASLFGANSSIHRKIGWTRYLALRACQWIAPYPEAIDQIAYDNSGHELEPEEARGMGIRVNNELAEFNRSDPYLGKVTVMMPDLRSGSSPFAWYRPARYIPGFILGPLSEKFRSVDPLIHYESGMLEYANTVGERRGYTGLDHSTVMADPGVLSDLYQRLTSRTDAIAHPNTVVAATTPTH